MSISNAFGKANALCASDSRLLRLSRSCGCLTPCMNAPPPFAVPDFAKQPLLKKNREATATGKKRRLDLSTPKRSVAPTELYALNYPLSESEGWSSEKVSARVSPHEWLRWYPRR